MKTGLLCAAGLFAIGAIGVTIPSDVGRFTFFFVVATIAAVLAFTGRKRPGRGRFVLALGTAALAASSFPHLLMEAERRTASNEALKDLRGAEQFILYSIQGSPAPSPPRRAAESEQFRGYPVLGKATIPAGESREELVMALNRSVQPMGDGPRPACFFPRHAIRATHANRTVDYLICFECRQIRVHGGTPDLLYTDTAPQRVLNTHLRKAGIALDPSMRGDL